MERFPGDCHGETICLEFLAENPNRNISPSEAEEATLWVLANHPAVTQRRVEATL